MAIDARRFWEEVRLGEDTGLELKEARFRGQQVSAPHRDGLADGLAAFANSGGGRLVLGVTNDREPQSLEPERLNALASLVTEVCSDSVEPPLEFSLYRCRPCHRAAGARCSSRYRPATPFIVRPAVF